MRGAPSGALLHVMRPTHSGITPRRVVYANITGHMLQVRRRGKPSGLPGRTSKGRIMKTLLNRLRAQAAKNAAYRQIRDEIANLSRAEALDLGIFPGDADRIARAAVWG